MQKSDNHISINVENSQKNTDIQIQQSENGEQVLLN